MNMYLKRLFFIVFFVGGTCAYSQTDSLTAETFDFEAPLTDTLQIATSSADSIHSIAPKTPDIIRISDAFLYTLSSPIRWQKNDLATLGVALGGTMLLSLADKPMNEFMFRDQGAFANKLGNFGYHNGKPYASVIVAGGFYATGWIINDEWTKETAAILTSAYATSGVLQSAMKKIVGRARPTEGLGNYSFRPFKNDPGFSSFPSGHSQIAFVTAIVLAERVDQTWLKGIFYTTAAVTMASRMYANAHWLSDVAFGGILAYFCTKTVIKRFDQTKYENPWEKFKKKNINWNFSLSGNGVGLIGTF
ncbi:phosphatase PAP2 family protein [Paenimyroides aestuarii]|uniref:Phosphatase PAP2 family protein n=1 Tax=Paenimyroides aestuarii TaxID=2968490 RepID=A0ABY5NPT5_9FLAO|nr:phosphatase PAP2 family protein [Paenimyroides aestuarii]UUV20531.1 phosphatase PAP2 family protein [Paenimyroides aestuarii]